MVTKGFHQFCKVVNTFLKAPDMTFLALQGALQAPKVRATYSRGFWGKNAQIILFPVFLEPKNQFPRQGWSSLKFSLKSNLKIYEEIKQIFIY